VSVRDVLAYVSALLALCGCGYYVLCLVAIHNFLAQPAPGPMPLPSVSVLKPLKGMDPALYESLRSHCLQEFPAEYEIIFGVSHLADAAVPFVQQLIAEFPDRAIRMIECPEASATNRKVGNLAQMVKYARYNHILVNDSDIRVSPTYLRAILSEFDDPAVGMCTAPYRAVAGRTIWSRVEALGIATDFIAGVLAARQLEGGIRFGLGSTLAFSRAALDAIGGFEPLFDYLGDDYELGARIASAGYKVVLSREVVDTFLPSYTFSGFLEHQLRWARAIRDSRPSQYVGMGVTFAVVWGIVAVLLSRLSWWSLLVLVIALALRIGVAWRGSQSVLHDQHARRDLWLVPLRDLLAFFVWLVSFFGATIVWRGERFRLQRGKLQRIST
jgi:ceramide glucosyltransferase